MKHSWISAQLRMGVWAGVSRATQFMAERLRSDKKARRIYEGVPKSTFVARPFS